MVLVSLIGTWPSSQYQLWIAHSCESGETSDWRKQQVFDIHQGTHVKGQVMNILCCHNYLTLPLSCESRNSQQVVNNCGCVLMKLYIQRQVTGQIWPIGFTLLTLDVVEKKMELCSTNITLRNLVSVKERFLYTPHPQKLEMFSLSQETIKTMKGIIPMKGITLGNYFESLMTNSMSSNTMKGTDALV